MFLITEGQIKMKTEKLVAHFKDGREPIEGQVVVPESLAELLKVYPEQRIYILGLGEYMRKAKKRLVSTRSPLLKLRVTDLTPDQQAVLRKLGLLKV
jgi:hypothetical protein